MTNAIYELGAQEYNLKLAEALKKIPEFKSPEWISYVKSGPSKERPIDEEDFWFKRSASILRQMYKKGILGVNRLRTKYGSKKDRGFRPEEFRKAGGKIIRTILQQADAAGLTEFDKGVKGIRTRKPGRKLTEKGKSFLENIGGSNNADQKSE
jgi:small subunit ribosomal protein S19e